MESRYNKYSSNDGEEVMTRTKKNRRLYHEINELEADSFDVNSNAVLLSNNGTVIDIDKLKDMLDKKYREKPRKSNPLATVDENEENQRINLDETRQYDINEILNKAREEKEDDYEVERLKKLRNTQVDILNELNIDNMKKVEYEDEEESEIKAVSDEEREKLKTLIDTINLTEETNAVKSIDPLDILSELKGDDDETKVEGVSDFTKEIIRQAKLEAAKEIAEERKQAMKEQVLEEKKIEGEKAKKELEDIEEETKEIKKDGKEGKIDKSFYTTSTMFKKGDFDDDFGDLKDEITATKVIVRILIIVVILAFIFGVVFLLNRILEWGLF